jgi:hypothetical protein
MNKIFINFLIKYTFLYSKYNIIIKYIFKSTVNPIGVPYKIKQNIAIINLSLIIIHFVIIIL